MIRIYNIKDKMEHLKEVSELTVKEWGKYSSQNEFNTKVKKKIEKIKNCLDRNDYCKLILLNNNLLIGFISIFPTDGDERKDLSPWYATMYVKKEYRNLGYSKILNTAILKEAKKRGFSKLYLKTDLNNYYEKFGAIYMEKLNNGEKLHYINC